MCKPKRLALALLLWPIAAWPQTTVDSSQRQSKASDFAPVQLPVLDPSLLQSTVSVSRPTPAKPAIDIQFDPTPTFVYPHDPSLTRWVTVKNNGGYVELAFSAVVNGPGGFSVPGNQLGIPPLPQPETLYLQPNESQRIWVLVNWSEVDRSSWQAGGTYDYRIDLSVYPKTMGPPPSQLPPETQVVSLHNTVQVAYTTLPPPRSQPTGDNNATIAGFVHDAATGKPLANAQVRLVSNTENGAYSPSTDNSGHYSIAVTAYRRVQQGVWADFGVTIQASGYADYHTAVAPHAGDTVSIDAPMTPAAQGPTYSIQSKYDGVLNQYHGEGSKDGKYFAMVPFHSIIPSGVDSQSYAAQSQLLFFSTGGTPLWQFPLYQQTPAVAVSDDGSFVATARCDMSRSDNGVYLLDNAGHIVWNAGNLANGANTFYEVRISHDNKYLAAGDTIGNLYLLDIASKKVVWQRFLNGQVRALEFESDNGTLYASSGDGYFYSFQINGTLNWRTYIGAWVSGFSLSKSYILAGGKEGYFISLMDRATGRTLWQYPIVQNGMNAAIAPDESYLLFQGTSAGFGTLLFDPSGVLLDHDDSTSYGAISSEGSYMLLTGQDIAADDTGTTWLKVMGRDGRQLWNSGSLDRTIHRGPLGGYAWMSSDGRKMVAADGNWVYFLTQQGPSISPGGVADAASYAPSAANGIAPGEMLTLFGQGLGPTQLTHLQLDSAGEVSTLLAGTKVLFDNTPGPLIYTSSGQVSVMAPYDLAGKNKVNITVQYQGLASPPMQFAVAPANPALFTLDASGKGDAAIVHVDGTPVNAANPAAAGEIVLLFAEGYGASVPALGDGLIVTNPLPTPALSTQLLIDGQPVATQYCGAAPLEVNGMLQINFQVPALAAGPHQIQLKVGNRTSPGGATLRTR